MLKHHDREKIIWDSHLTPNEKLTTLALNSFVDGNGECWPGQELLARMTGFTDRTIRNICTTLEEKLIITRSHRQRKDGSRTSDKYRINFDAIASIQPETVSARKKKQPKRKTSKALTQPENISARLEIQPENDDIPTGTYFRLEKSQGDRQDVLAESVSPSFDEKIQPETVSGDLSSINLTIQKEPSSSDTFLQPSFFGQEDIKTTAVELTHQENKRESSAIFSKKKKIYSPEELEIFRVVFNQSKPVKWKVADKITPGRAKRISQRVIAVYGDRSLEVWQRALLGARQDPWFAPKNWTMDNFLSSGKNKEQDFVTSLSEKAIESESVMENCDMSEAAFKRRQSCQQAREMINGF